MKNKTLDWNNVQIDDEVFDLGHENTSKYFRNKEEYYQSKEWQAKRLVILQRAKYQCEKCGANLKLDIHHLTYKNLYHELPEDLVALCRECHKKADAIRSHTNWYNNALDTYMSKKYGEDFEYQDAEEFDNWLQSKGEF